jgi:hypothetical protein
MLVGSLSIGLGALSCVLVGILAWLSGLFPRSSSPASVNEVHVYFDLSFGSFALIGWQVWVFFGGMALVGILAVLLGLHLLCPRDASC